MEARRDALIGAEPHERAEERDDYRNGYYLRKQFQTAIGRIEGLRIPRRRIRSHCCMSLYTPFPSARILAIPVTAKVTQNPRFSRSLQGVPPFSSAHRPAALFNRRLHLSDAPDLPHLGQPESGEKGKHPREDGK